MYNDGQNVEFVSHFTSNYHSPGSLEQYLWSNNVSTVLYHYYYCYHIHRRRRYLKKTVNVPYNYNIRAYFHFGEIALLHHSSPSNSFSDLKFPLTERHWLIT